MEKLPHQMDKNLVIVQILLKSNNNDYAFGLPYEMRRPVKFDVLV